MKTNILLPTDFSDNAWSAAVYALKLYEKVECTFYFLNATKFKASTLSSLSNKSLEDMSDLIINELLTLKKMAEDANVGANHDFKTIFKNEGLKNAIKATLIERKIDLIVIGAKGKTKAKELFFGSNTIDIINEIDDCPVLIVPEEYDFEEPKQIAFPTDFTRFFGEELIPLKQTAELYNSKIKILHITEKDNLSKSQDYNLAMLKAYLEDYPHSFHWMPNYTIKTEAIKDFIGELQINMLAMIYYKHGLIETILKEPVVKKIGFYPVIPFLVIPQKN